jgi:hypothetical protein
MTKNKNKVEEFCTKFDEMEIYNSWLLKKGIY